MKKLLVLALAVVMLVSAFALTACASEATYTGEVHYNSYGTEYGCKVDVTVKGDVITAVRLYTDAESGYKRTSANNPEYGWDGFDKTEAAYEQWIKDTFVGKTVAEVNAYVASATADGQTVGEGTPNIAGSTQSAARVIVAVKDALSKIAA